MKIYFSIPLKASPHQCCLIKHKSKADEGAAKSHDQSHQNRDYGTYSRTILVKAAVYYIDDNAVKLAKMFVVRFVIEFPDKPKLDSAMTRFYLSKHTHGGVCVSQF